MIQQESFWGGYIAIIRCNFLFTVDNTVIQHNGPWFTFPFMHIWWHHDDVIRFKGKSYFFFSIFINLYLGLVEVGERTYINGPPNPPLNLPAHLCSISYRTMYCKTRKMEKLLIRSRRTFMVGWLQLRGWKSKNNYPKGDSITEQNVAGWGTIDLS